MLPFSFILNTLEMPQLNNLQPTTELEAVNAMLSAIGQTPVDDLTVEQADVEMAVSLLRQTSKKVQTEGWQFNVDLGYPLEPHGELEWTGHDGAPEDLNVFVLPAGVARWHVTQTYRQMGSYTPDVVVRKPVHYAGADTILYDRVRHREGLSQELFPVLYLDIAWLLDFDALPETARAFIFLSAARKFIAHTVGSSELVGFSAHDEVAALRLLENDQGDEETYNMMDAGDVRRAGVRRRITPNGFDGRRVYPGGA